MKDNDIRTTTFHFIACDTLFHPVWSVWIVFWDTASLSALNRVCFKIFAENMIAQAAQRQVWLSRPLSRVLSFYSVSLALYSLSFFPLTEARLMRREPRSEDEPRISSSSALESKSDVSVHDPSPGSEPLGGAGIVPPIGGPQRPATKLGSTIQATRGSTHGFADPAAGNVHGKAHTVNSAATVTSSAGEETSDDIASAKGANAGISGSSTGIQASSTRPGRNGKVSDGAEKHKEFTDSPTSFIQIPTFGGPSGGGYQQAPQLYQQQTPQYAPPSSFYQTWQQPQSLAQMSFQPVAMQQIPTQPVAMQQIPTQPVAMQQIPIQQPASMQQVPIQQPVSMQQIGPMQPPSLIETYGSTIVPQRYGPQQMAQQIPAFQPIQPQVQQQFYQALGQQEQLQQQPSVFERAQATSDSESIATDKVSSMLEKALKEQEQQLEKQEEHLLQKQESQFEHQESQFEAQQRMATEKLDAKIERKIEKLQAEEESEMAGVKRRLDELTQDNLRKTGDSETTEKRLLTEEQQSFAEKKQRELAEDEEKETVVSVSNNAASPDVPEKSSAISVEDAESKTSGPISLEDAEKATRNPKILEIVLDSKSEGLDDDTNAKASALEVGDKDKQGNVVKADSTASAESAVEVSDGNAVETQDRKNDNGATGASGAVAASLMQTGAQVEETKTKVEESKIQIKESATARSKEQAQEQQQTKEQEKTSVEEKHPGQAGKPVTNNAAPIPTPSLGQQKSASQPAANSVSQQQIRPVQQGLATQAQMQQIPVQQQFAQQSIARPAPPAAPVSSSGTTAVSQPIAPINQQPPIAPNINDAAMNIGANGAPVHTQQEDASTISMLEEAAKEEVSKAETSTEQNSIAHDLSENNLNVFNGDSENVDGDSSFVETTDHGPAAHLHSQVPSRNHVKTQMRNPKSHPHKKGSGYHHNHGRNRNHGKQHGHQHHHHASNPGHRKSDTLGYASAFDAADSEDHNDAASRDSSSMIETNAALQQRLEFQQREAELKHRKALGSDATVELPEDLWREVLQQGAEAEQGGQEGHHDVAVALAKGNSHKYSNEQNQKQERRSVEDKKASSFVDMEPQRDDVKTEDPEQSPRSERNPKSLEHDKQHNHFATYSELLSKWSTVRNAVSDLDRVQRKMVETGGRLEDHTKKIQDQLAQSFTNIAGYMSHRVRDARSPELKETMARDAAALAGEEFPDHDQNSENSLAELDHRKMLHQYGISAKEARRLGFGTTDSNYVNRGRVVEVQSADDEHGDHQNGSEEVNGGGGGNADSEDPRYVNRQAQRQAGRVGEQERNSLGPSESADLDLDEPFPKKRTGWGSQLASRVAKNFGY